MQNRTTLTESALRLDPSLVREDILLPVDYNLVQNEDGRNFSSFQI